MAAFPDDDPQREKWTGDLVLKIEAALILMLQLCALLLFFL